MNDPTNFSPVDAAWQGMEAEMEAELDHILQYWQRFTIDESHEGFYGRINAQNVVDERAPKGSVLNARILWTFSAAYNLVPHPVYLELATRAYQYLRVHLTDQIY